MTGLNRSVQLAGARNTITSLWSVSDAGAADLFSAFYAALWEDGQSVADASHAAQQSMRDERYGPGVWAGFVRYATGSVY